MAANKQLLVLPGDCIGPEVMSQVLRVVDWFDKRRAVRFDLKEGLVGGAALDKQGTPISEQTLADAKAADAVLFGSVGGPKWDTNPFDKKHERGILALRKELDLFANLRPAPVFDALIDASTLKKEVVQGTDLLVLREGTFTDIMHDYYRGDRAMAWLLLTVIVSLLVVTALGIVGLASFWVQQRTKQIGIRRALGATKGQILRYFQTENFLLATIGIVIGMILAYGINQLLMGKYELPRLPLLYLPVGAVLLWLLGQVAVYGPARKAASVPPAVATRTA